MLAPYGIITLFKELHKGRAGEENPLPELS